MNWLVTVVFIFHPDLVEKRRRNPGEFFYLARVQAVIYLYTVDSSLYQAGFFKLGQVLVYRSAAQGKFVGYISGYTNFRLCQVLQNCQPCRV